MGFNKKAELLVSRAKFGRNFVRPLYENYCFANIPGTILNLFGITKGKALPDDVLGRKNSEKVVFLFLDGFGWESWEKVYRQHPALTRFYKEGVVSQITSQFPSTTAPHVTAIHTGLDVGESGIYEWYYYEPCVDSIISPLQFSFAGDKNRDTLKSVINPSEIFPSASIYKSLKDNGVTSYIFQHKEHIPSPYLDVVLEGATQKFPYQSLTEGLTVMSEIIKNTTGPAYYFFYYGKIDTVGHIEGPNTSAYFAEVHNFLVTLENLFLNKIEDQQGLTILASADHGMVNLEPQQTFYLNKELPELSRYIKKNRKGELLVPAGSCRDFFLYIEEANLVKIKTILSKKLEGLADVYTIKDLISRGFFSSPSSKLLDRLGNLVILPHDGEAVWWYEKGKFEQKYYGHHGGLTTKEMIVPFLSLDF